MTDCGEQMGSISEGPARRLSSFGDSEKTGTIEVVSRAFDILRCFDDPAVRLGNGDISARCSLPRSTVSRLTQTLTRIGWLAYIRQEQKYRIGPSAIAMCLSMSRSSDLHERLHAVLKGVADEIPCVVGLAIPDRSDVILAQAATSTGLVGLRAKKGNRLPMARTAAGHAYAAVLDPVTANNLLHQIAQKFPADAERLGSRLEQDRVMLRERGSVIACGLFRAHLNAIAVPFWSSLYGTFVVLTVGVRAIDYGESRIHNELSPLVKRLSKEVRSILDLFDGNADGGTRTGNHSALRRLANSFSMGAMR